VTSQRRKSIPLTETVSDRVCGPAGRGIGLCVLPRGAPRSSSSLRDWRGRGGEALLTAALERRVHRGSAGEVDELAKAVGAEARVSKADAPRSRQDLDREPEKFRNLDWSGTIVSRVFLEAMYFTARVGGNVALTTLLILRGTLNRD